MRRSVILSLAAVLSAPPLLVHAAAASGPDVLPAQVAGVVGSGAQLALQLKALGEAPARTLHIGDTFEDGWVLSGLDTSTATLTKAGVTRTVGLNPSGAVAGGTAPLGGSTVTVIAPTRPPPRPPPSQEVIDAQLALARATAAQNGATAEFDASAKADQRVRDAGAALTAALAAQSAATPETQAAALRTRNQAVAELVAAQDAQILAHAKLDSVMVIPVPSVSRGQPSAVPAPPAQ